MFPAAHVCLRLELAALGNWPHTTPPTNDATRVSSAMLKVQLLSFGSSHSQCSLFLDRSATPQISFAIRVNALWAREQVLAS